MAAEPITAEPKLAEAEPAEPSRVTGKEVRARIAPGHAMPLDSFTAGVTLDSVREAEEPAPRPQRRRVGVLATVGAAVVVAIAVAYPLSHSNSSASATVAATQGTSSGSVASSSSSTSNSSSPSSAPSLSHAAAPPPVSSSSAAVPHKSGAITNVGDGDAIDVFSTTAGTPIYTDGARLTVDPLAGRGGQSFQATALTAGGHPAYEFGVGLDTDELLDAGSGKVALKHCACGSPAQPPTQLWSLSQDTSTPSGAFYLNSQGTAGQCLTDNGPSIALSLKPCVAGNKAQQWYLP